MNLQNYNFSKNKKLDEDLSFKNLNLFLEISKEKKINCFLLFGTLLGFYRDKKFINEDNDTDIGCTWEEFKIVERDFFSKLTSSGFKIYRESNSLIQIVKNNNHIDLYIFRKLPFFNGRFSGKFFISNLHFKTISSIKLVFNGYDYPILSEVEKLLTKFYGKNWKTPLKGKTANENILLKIMVKILPTRIIKFIQKMLK
tara:strand:- start:18723 stop:19319 length:597 start_codon:yes stop_codon:yes gene_type:complete